MDLTLNEPDIRALFDAIHLDSGKEGYDPDLPMHPETFSKAIQRERAFWLEKFSPDKK